MRHGYSYQTDMRQLHSRFAFAALDNLIDRHYIQCMRDIVLTKLTAVKMPNGMFKIAYDGTILGDDRAFSSERLAFQEIRKRLDKDAREAVIYNRPLLYTADLIKEFPYV